MKNIKLLFVILISLAFLVFDDAQGQDPFTNGLVAYYSFNGNANDASGNGNNGSVSGATLATDRFGNPNTAYYFAGDDGHISIPDSTSLAINNSITLVLWLKIEAGGYVQPRIIEKHVFDLGLSDTGSAPQIFLNIQPYTQPGIGVITSPVSAGRWIFLVGTYDLQTLRLYTNGVVAAQTSGSAPLEINNLPIGIGRNLDSSSGADWFKGFIDDIRIYNRAFSSNEVTQLFAIESGPQLDLIKAVKPSFSGLIPGTNYQLQLSGNMSTWTNHGAAFTATNSSMVYSQYWDVDNWGKLFFRLQVSP